ncbi:MAG: hypothetical protein ACRBHB_13315 [Arenicella sp.]
MRYREDIPREQLAQHASDDMLLFTAFLGIIIGLALTWLGRKGKIMWMTVWAIGLILCSIFLGASMIYDWQLTALREWLVPS